MSEGPVADVAGPRIMVVSLPKSGTHVVVSILRLLPGLTRQRRLMLNRKLRWHPFNFVPFVGAERCLIGITGPRQVKIAALAHNLGRIGPWRFATGHVPYQPKVLALFDRLGITPFFMLRNPRDVVVSSVFYAVRKTDHYRHSAITSFATMQARLRASIVGGVTPRGDRYLGLGQQLDSVIPYTCDPRVMTIRFEELVGGQGGGDDEVQAIRIAEIAKRIGFGLDAAEARRIGQEMFGRGRTFRAGRIGGWQEYWDEELETLFQEHAGDQARQLGYK